MVYGKENKHYPAYPVLAVGAVVFNENRVLLVKRGCPPGKGLWAVPGGKVRIGETLQQAGEREVLEETSLVVRCGKPVYTFDMIERDQSGRVRFHYCIVDLEAVYLSGDIRAGDDAAAACWISVNDLKCLDVNRKTRELLREVYDFG